MWRRSYQTSLWLVSVLSLLVLALLLLVIVPTLFSPEIVLPVQLSLTGLGVAAVLINVVFSWDRDRFLARSCVASDLAASIARVDGGFGKRLRFNNDSDEIDGASLKGMQQWMRTNAVVERSLPPSLEVIIDLLLLFSGAVLANPFTDLFRGLAPGGDELTFSWPQAAAIVACVAVVGIAITPWGRPDHLWEKLSQMAHDDPSNFYENLPVGNRRFVRVLREEIDHAYTILETRYESLLAVAAVAGVSIDDGPGRKLTSSFAVTFKFWQFGAGLALGSIFELS